MRDSIRFNNSHIILKNIYFMKNVYSKNKWNTTKKRFDYICSKVPLGLKPKRISTKSLKLAKN